MAKTKNSVDFSAENSERVEHFFDVLKKEISDTTEKIIKDAEAEKKKIVAKANEDSLQKAYDDIQGSAKASERKYSLITAKSELEISRIFFVAAWKSPTEFSVTSAAELLNSEKRKSIFRT